MPPPDNRTAICPGTFDPVTYGHMDVISRASAMYDSVIVGVVNVPWRKGSTLFTVEERIAFVTNAVGGMENVSVEPFSTLLVEFARARGAMAIVKGLRAISDFEYETEMTQLNRHLASDLESVFIMASPQYSFLSSSGVKELAIFGGDVSELVPKHVEGPLKEALAR